MAKYNLSDQYVAEAMEYQRLVLLGTGRTSVGNPTYTSASSAVVYTVIDGTGEDGIMALLATALADFIVTAGDWNGLIDYVDTTVTDALTTISENFRIMMLGGVV